MPLVLTEAVSSRNRPTKSEKQRSLKASHVLETIEQHVLLDGFKIVIDLEKSRGSYLFNRATGHRLIDLYGFFGSNPVGFNHPHFARADVKADRTAQIKIANSRLGGDSTKAVELFFDRLSSREARRVQKCRSPE